MSSSTALLADFQRQIDAALSYADRLCTPEALMGRGDCDEAIARKHLYCLAQAHRALLRRTLKMVYDHWCEFGPNESVFQEDMAIVECVLEPNAIADPRHD